nr:helix-turn-helix transcriptional regulator [uncultured Roseateles sp.]
MDETNPHEMGMDAAGDAPETPKRQVPGHRLLKLIRRNLEEQGLPEKAMADLIGVTPVYWNSLSNGNRSLSSLGREKGKRLADWLGISYLQVLLLSDSILMDDLFATTTLDEDLFAVRCAMQADPSVAAFAPTDAVWEAADRSVKVTIAIMYERLSEKRLIRRAWLEGMPHPQSVGILEF